MPVKILMCPCYKDYFLQSGEAIIKCLAHFHCKCDEKNHQMYVHFCKCHPFGSTVLNHLRSNEETETACFLNKLSWS